MIHKFLDHQLQIRFRHRLASLFAKTGGKKTTLPENERARFIIRDADTLRLSPEVVLQEGRRRQREEGNEERGRDARKRQNRRESEV